MSRLAKLTEDGQGIVDYPLTLADLKAEMPLRGWPGRPTKETLEDTGYVLVEETDRPEAEYGETVVEAPPVFSDGAWRQAWTTQKISLAQAKQELAQMAADIYVSRVTNPTVQQLVQSGYVGAIQARSTQLKPAFDGIITRIQGASSAAEARAILAELEAAGAR